MIYNNLFRFFLWACIDQKQLILSLNFPMLQKDSMCTLEEHEDADRICTEAEPDIQVAQFPQPKLLRLIIDPYYQYANSNFHEERNPWGIKFQTDSRYQLISYLDQNPYGSSAIAKDIQTDESVILAKFINIFNNPRYARKTLKELRLLRLMNHENIYRITDILLPKSRREFNDIFVCFEAMPSSIGRLLRMQQGISEEQARIYAYQTLKGLKYVHNAGIIHGNLNPDCILVDPIDDSLKIAGFRMSTIVHFETYHLNKMYNYPRDLYCGAPELILEIGNYGPSVDIWSLGYILAHMMGRRLLFPKATDTENSIELAFGVFGTPEAKYFDKVRDSRIRRKYQSLPVQKAQDLETLFPVDTDPLAIDLIQKMMTLDWEERISVEDALRHPYFRELHDPYQEPIGKIVPEEEFVFEKECLPILQIKDLIYEESLLYHFENFKEEYFQRVYKDLNKVV